MEYRIRNQTDLFERISEHPPLTLILGSGFSHGIIPTTAEIVRKDLPWWKWCQRKETTGAKPRDFRDNIVTRDDDAAKAEAVSFWKRVHNAQQPTTSKEKFELGPDGLPTSKTIGEAYRFALSPECTPGLNSPGMVRQYIGDIIRRAGNRLNPAHLFLASIIAENPRLFRTIFTTNFDPLLQRSLQLVNAPYFVSDRPETLQNPEDDDVADAVHIIHAHGSIYRYLLLNSPEEIERYAEENQGKLQTYFRNHAVLIVGFRGWDDAITRALKNVDQFNHNLYWCDRSSDPDKSSLTDDAREILKKHNNAFYVPIDPIKGADDLMVYMHQHLIRQDLPRIFREPIVVAIEQLELCKLTGYKLSSSGFQGDLSTPDKGISAPSDPRDLGEEIKSIKKRLDKAQLTYLGEHGTDSNSNLADRVRARFFDARDLYFKKNFLEALPHLEYVVEHDHVLDPDERALARFRRGVVYGERRQKGDVELAVADYTAVIAMPDAPLEQRVKSCINRGNAYGQSTQAKDVKLAITDYTSVINMLDAPAEQRAQAHINRGITYGKRGDLELAMVDYTAVIEMTDLAAELWAIAHLNRGFIYSQSRDVARAIADYTCVIDMPDATAELRAMAHLNRGFVYDKFGNVELAISDCTAVIEMPDANAEQRAGARINRGMAYVERGQAGDVKLAVADYTAVIDMPDATAELRAKALYNRGVAYSQSVDAEFETLAVTDYTAVIDMHEATPEPRARAYVSRGNAYRMRGDAQNMARAIADYTAVIDMPDAPVEQRASAHLNRGVAYSRPWQKRDLDRAIADYTAVIVMPDANAEQRAMARFNRGNAYTMREQLGDLDRAIADYTALIDMPDAPVEQLANAHLNRGVAYSQSGDAEDLELAIADYTAVIDMPDAPAEQRARAYINRGITYGKRKQEGDVKRAVADYTAVIKMPNVPAEQQADARLNRGITYGQRGDAGDVKYAIADFTAVIDMPDANDEQRADARNNRDLLVKPKKLPPKKKRK